MIQLAYPWALLALFSLPVILVLHSLRPKRRRLVLSTTLLWREALREQQRGLGLQKLLRDLSLLLMLLFALIVSVALSGPQWLTRSTEQPDTVLVLDVSASMKARAGTGTRFALAREQAADLIAGLPEGGRMAIMSSGRNPILRSAFESNKEHLRSVLAQIQPTDEVGQPRAALALALALLRNREQGRVYFLTDAAFDEDVNFVSPLIEYRIVAAAGESRNIAITRFDFRPEVGTEERFQMLLAVRNYTDQAHSVPALVTLDRVRLFDENLQLPPGEEKTIVLAFQGQAVGQAQAGIDFDDDLAADNQAFAVMSVDEGLDVLLFSRGNFYLESVFAALPNVRYSRLEAVPPADELARQARRHDLVVFDRLSVSSLPPGNYLLIDTIAAELPFSDSGSLVANPFIEGKSASMLVDQVDLSGVRIDAARRIVMSAAAPGLQRLFWSQETDLALALLQNDIRLVYLGFDLAQSNFPLQAAFPLFIRQSFAWLRPRRNSFGFAGTQLTAGETFPIEVPDAQSSVIIGTPSGDGLIYQVEDGRLLFDATSEAGIYQYRVSDIERYFAVNLTDAQESDIAPRAALAQTPAAAPAGPADAQVVMALWPYLAMLALALLTLEWCLWCARRGSA